MIQERDRQIIEGESFQAASVHAQCMTCHWQSDVYDYPGGSFVLDYNIEKHLKSCNLGQVKVIFSPIPSGKLWKEIHEARQSESS